MNRVTNYAQGIFDQGSVPARVAIYTRFSSDLQRDSSTEDQIRECREAAEERDGMSWTEYIRF